MSKITRTAGQLPSKVERRRERIEFMLLDQQMILNGMLHAWSTVASGDVDSSNRNLVEVLDDLRFFVQEHGIDLTQYKGIVDEYLERLSETGGAAYNKFLPQAAQQQISQFEEQQAGEQGVSLNFLEMSAAPRSFLWEVLYAGDPLDDVDPQQFWGFRYRLGRTYTGIQWQNNFHLGGGVFSAIHDGLDFSKEELNRLSEHILSVCEQLGLAAFKLHHVDQCMAPESVSIKDFIKFLIGDQFNYGLAHFACHCENPDEISVDKAYLSFTAHGQNLEMSLERLVSLKGKYNFGHRQPFFFLNACESATPGHIMHKLSFPTGFLGLGASGVIATACIMPDNFASAFATEFYRRLLTKPSATDSVYVGDALLETRLHFWEKYNNPLGLAYGLYAVSDQQLRLMD